MRVIDYRLPGGRVVPVDATACKDARMIDFTLADGRIVLAIQTGRPPYDLPETEPGR